MPFDPVDLVEQQDALIAHKVGFVLWPKAWREYPLRRRLSWTTRSLEKSQKPNVPKASGIYTLVVQPRVAKHPACSYLMYVGQTVNLQDRFYDYCTSERRIRPKIVRLLHRWDGFIIFCFCRIRRSNLTKVEDALIAAYVPPTNSDYPATIRPATKAF